jgi:CRP-like cAMP-binding protein
VTVEKSAAGVLLGRTHNGQPIREKKLRKHPGRQDSIVNRISEGSVNIESEKEFDNLLKIFPNEPSLHRALADLLVKKGAKEAADDAYEQSVGLFIEKGRILSAIVAKILKWRIVRPRNEEGRDFYRLICDCKVMDAPLNRFLSGLSYHEFISLLLKMVPCRFLADTIIKRPGDIENHLYFVVSGAVNEITLPRSNSDPASNGRYQTDLIESDFLGDIYPFEQEKVSHTQASTITNVEVVKISKPDLIKIGKKYGDLGLKIDRLYRWRNESSDDAETQVIRKTVRHQMPTRVYLMVFDTATGGHPQVIEGFADDVSSGGACVVIGEQYRFGPPAAMVGKNVKLEVVLSNAAVRLAILGRIVWGKDILLEGKKSVAVGVRFTKMTDNDRELLHDYCCGSAGEQNLIWSLWETMVK